MLSVIMSCDHDHDHSKNMPVTKLLKSSPSNIGLKILSMHAGYTLTTS